MASEQWEWGRPDSYSDLLARDLIRAFPDLGECTKPLSFFPHFSLLSVNSLSKNYGVDRLYHGLA